MKKIVGALFVFFTIQVFAQENFHLLSTMSGDSTGDQFSVVSHIGDVNADGYDDVIVGAPGGDYAKLFFGGEIFDTIPDLTLRDYKEFNCRFGCSIAGGRDINGDGYPDIIIGASSTWIGPSCPFECLTTGAAYVYFGGPGIDTTADLTLIVGSWEEGVGWNYQFGYSVAIVGDMNGDGYDEFAISAPTAGYYENGRVYIYFGGPNVDEHYEVLLEGEDRSDNFGFSLSAVGDINNDGLDEILIGAPHLEVNPQNPYQYPGKAYLVYGGEEIIIANAEAFFGDSSKIYYGRVVSGLGDVNGDHYPDLGIMGDKYFKITSGKNFYAILTVLTNADNYEAFYALTGCNDINNDGIDDILISIQEVINHDIFNKILLYKGSSSIDSISDEEIKINAYGYVKNISPLGDINDDSLQEIIIGVDEWDSTGQTIRYGKSYIYTFDRISSINEIKNYLPKRFILFPNYPNPFNSSTIIKYSIPKQEQVTLKIYDQLGRLIATLINGIQKEGEHQIQFQTESLPSGVYFCQLNTGNVILTNKLLLLK